MPSKSFANEFYVHDLEKLVKLAGLEKDHKIKLRSEPDFASNWTIIKDWNEGARYSEWYEYQAKELYDAIENINGGIFSWIQQYW